MNELDFNTLNHLATSDYWKIAVEEASRSIKTMQTEVKTPTISPHVIPSIFKKKEIVQYVVAVAGEQLGPFSKIQILQMLKEKKITSDYYIWTNGWSDWKIIKECPEIIGGMNNG